MINYAAFPGCAEDTETSPQVLVKLIDILKKNDVPVVFKTELSNGNIAKTLSEATGAKYAHFIHAIILQKMTMKTE